jgi:hypothetical protein
MWECAGWFVGQYSGPMRPLVVLVASLHLQAVDVYCKAEGVVVPLHVAMVWFVCIRFRLYMRLVDQHVGLLVVRCFCRITRSTACIPAGGSPAGVPCDMPDCTHASCYPCRCLCMVPVFGRWYSQPGMCWVT